MESAKIGMNAHLHNANTVEEKDRKLKKACRDFEAVLTYQVLKSMRKTIGKCDLLNGGQGEEIFQSLFDMQISKNMSDFGPNSLARLLYQQLKGHVSPSQGQKAGGTKAAEGLQPPEKMKDRVE